MFASIARFEFRYQLRNPVFWVAFAMFFLFAFGSIASDNIQIGDGGNVHGNAPRAIILTHLVMAILFMFALAAMVANVVIRDDETRFGPLIRTTRITKSAYLLGRFTGAWGASALCYASVPLALWIGSLMPWIDPATLGPNRLATYLFAYGVMGLPVLLVTGAMLFAVATATRSMMATYLAIVVFFAGYAAITALIGTVPSLRPYAPFVEPFGIAAFSLETRYWTAADSNMLLPSLVGPIGWSRLLWIGIAGLLLAVAQWRYRFADRGISRRATRRQARATAIEAQARPVPNTSGPLPRPAAGGTWRAQLIARTAMEVRQIVRSPAFLILLLLGFVIAMPQMWFGAGQYGTQILPLTRRMVEGLKQSFALMPMIVAIYYSGELVWRERERRFAEIVDATPLPGWAFLVPKMLGVTLALVAMLAAGMLGGIAIQLLRGFGGISVLRYLDWYLLPMTVDMVLMAALAVFVQALSPSKYVGWGLLVVYLVATMVLGQLGLEDRLYLYGEVPPAPLSDMNPDGGMATAAWAFRLYWAAFAVVLLTLAHLLWRRGTDARLLGAMRRLPARLRGSAGLTLAAAMLAFLMTGAFLWYNTHRLNPYRTERSEEAYTADYERALLRFEGLPQPAVRRISLAVDLRPRERLAEITGAYRLVNDTGRPLDRVHVRLRSRDLELVAIRLPGARLERNFGRFGYRIYRFDMPLLPGQAREMRFHTRLWHRGIANGGADTRLVANGTFLRNDEIAPQIGMDRSGLLDDRRTRHRQGLPGELRTPKLEDIAAQRHNDLHADWTLADITVTTDAGQTPIAPGRKVLDRTASGRRTARFVSDAPILNFFSIQSAAYAQVQARHRGVSLAVYYHPGHPWNVDRMMRAMASSLDYYQAAFGPYQFDQARIIEFPGYSKYAQSFANTVPYSEDMGFNADLRDATKIDYVTYVTAHEIAHQYWGHQLVGADMQGATALSETLAQYSALMVMKRLYGPDRMRRFLRYELDSYLAGRRGDALGEVPLGRVEGQQYIHYRKGSVAMYQLQDRLGEAAVNRALADVLRRHRFRGAPYPRSVDLVAALRARARTTDQQTLITDLFERIVIYDVKATAPISTRTSDGRWRTTFTLSATKFVVDGQGRETATGFAEPVDIGAFRSEPGEGRFDRSDVLMMEKRVMRPGEQTMIIVTRDRPAYVGVDPYNLMIDRTPRDNVVAVGD
jgi:hypothetical protein